MGSKLEDTLCLFPDVVKGEACEADSDDPVVSSIEKLVVESKGGSSESALITVINTTIQRNTARWPWEGIRAKPTEDTAAAIIQGCPVKASHPCIIANAVNAPALPVVLLSLKPPLHVELQRISKKTGAPQTQSLCADNGGNIRD